MGNSQQILHIYTQILQEQHNERNTQNGTNI